VIAYCTQLHFDASHGMDGAWEVLSRWAYLISCRNLEGNSVPPNREEWNALWAVPDGRYRASATTQLRWGVMEGRRALEFTFPDRDVPRRQWKFNFSFCYSGKRGVQVNLVARVEDTAPRGGLLPVPLAQPGIIRDLIATVGLGSKEPTRRAETLSLGRLQDLIGLIRDPARQHALVIMSPRQGSSSFTIDPTGLQVTLAGLAQVRVLPDAKTCWDCSSVLGNTWNSYNGSIRLLLPVREGCREEDGVPTHLFLPWEIDEMARRRVDPAERLLSLIGAEVNRRIALETLTPEVLLVERHREMISRLKAELAGGPDHARIAAAERSLEDWRKREGQLEELMRLFEEDNRRLQDSQREAEAALARREAELTKSREVNEALELECSSMRNQFRAFSPPPMVAESSPAKPEVKVRKLTELGDLVALHFSGRLVLSKRAQRSLEDCPYHAPQDAWEIFELLATTYWDAFQNGLSANTEVGTKDLRHAASTIGWEYAPHMAAGTTQLYAGYEMRYKDRQANMNRHLKRGKSRNPRFSMRVHFEYDPDDKVIVVHHAGRHLDNSHS
jgi:hypothetical protein